MSIIAVKVPYHWNLKSTVSKLIPFVGGRFEAINFAAANSVTGIKTCYLKLSERLDPQQVIEKITTMRVPKFGKINAFVPKNVPDLLPASVKPIRPRAKLLAQHKIENEWTQEEAMIITHRELLTEMQLKYTGLYNLSRRTNHALMEKISLALFDRLKSVMERNKDVQHNCFKLSKAYRKAHPHFADFELILSTLHELEDEAGQPRTQIMEEKLMDIETYLAERPYPKIMEATSKYCMKVACKVQEHLSTIEDVKPAPGDKDAEVRRRVRHELAKLHPYMHTMVRQIITKHVLPQKRAALRVRIYGEPFLPNVTPFLRKCHISENAVVRSQRIYNMVTFMVSPFQLPALLKKDGTNIGGSTLIIRVNDIELYKVPRSLEMEMRAYFGVTEYRPIPTDIAVDYIKLGEFVEGDDDDMDM